MKIAVMGYGVVGSGVVKVLKMNKKSIKEKSKNGEIEVKYILDIKDIKDENSAFATKNFDDILNDDEVKAVVETMGGVHPAFEFVTACLKKGKSVVSSNKELVAEKGLEIMKTAEENGVLFEFEASVAGGIPVIRAITDSLNSNEITDIAGIINGTTNFILTKMIEDNMDYATALKLAQENGYAEKDPTADVEGLDAGRKICILSALAYGKHVYPKQVYTQGISALSLEDVSLAGELGFVIKLIARAKKENDKLSVMVSPALVAKESPLSFVKDVMNAVLIRGNAVKETMLYGPGAGMMPTASAVVSDVIDVCNKYGKESQMFWREEAEDGYVLDYLDTKTRLFVRGEKFDFDKVRQVLGEAHFSSCGTAFITGEDTERNLLSKIESLDLEVKSIIRVVNY